MNNTMKKFENELKSFGITKEDYCRMTGISKDELELIMSTNEILDDKYFLLLDGLKYRHSDSHSITKKVGEDRPKLTLNQKGVLKCVEDFIDRKGMPPTRQELSEIMRI